MRIDNNFGVSLRAGLSAKSFAREVLGCFARSVVCRKRISLPSLKQFTVKRKYYFQKKFQLLNPKFQSIEPHSFYFQKRDHVNKLLFHRKERKGLRKVRNEQPLRP